jgi:hypothetical protein
MADAGPVYHISIEHLIHIHNIISAIYNFEYLINHYIAPNQLIHGFPLSVLSNCCTYYVCLYYALDLLFVSDSRKGDKQEESTAGSCRCMAPYWPSPSTRRLTTTPYNVGKLG